MLTLRGSAQTTRDLMTALSNDLSNTGGELVEVLGSLHRLETERQNIRELMEVSTRCMRIAKMMQITTSYIDITSVSFKSILAKSAFGPKLISDSFNIADIAFTFFFSGSVISNTMELVSKPKKSFMFTL